MVHEPLPSLDPIRNNFFDAVGTVRMEAFVEGKEKRREGRERKVPPQPLGNSWAKKQGKKDLRYWGVGGESVGGSSVGGVRGDRGLEDPFGGF